MRPRVFVGLVVVVTCVLLSSPITFAQETTGSIVGTVTSEDGAPLQGVTVVIEDLERGLRRVAISGRTGDFAVAALPPAHYQLTANQQGFQGVKRQVQVELGSTLRHDITMQADDFTDVIDMTIDSPPAVVNSAVSGITVGTDQLNARMPLQREASYVALLAPATVQGAAIFNGNTPGQDIISVGGASVAENSYQVNGLNITNFRTGLGSSMVPMEFVKEIQVKTGGYAAEYGRATGGVINMVTKSGSNSLHGSFSAYFEPESLQSQEPDTYTSENQKEDRELLEVNASLGGAIAKDKLFFFGFMRYTDSEYWSNISDEDAAPGQYGNTKKNSYSNPYWGGKIDWNITSNHRVEGTYLSDQVDVNNTQYEWDRVGDTGLGELQGESINGRGGDNYIFKYTGIFVENFLLSAQYGVNNFDRTRSSTVDQNPAVYDHRSGSYDPIGAWVNSTVGSSVDEREAYRLDADLYLGSHSLRAGADYEQNLTFNLLQYSGGYSLLYSTAGNQGYTEDMQGNALNEDDQVVRIAHWDRGGGFDVDSKALYAQDSWVVSPQVTVNLGVRYEEFENRNGLGERFIKIDGQWAPRLGIIWNPSAEGRSKVYMSFGRYYLPIPSNINVRLAPNSQSDRNWYVFNAGAYDPNDLWNGMDPITAIPDGYVDCGFGNPSACANNGTVGNGISWQTLEDEVPDARQTLSTNLEPMSQNELILGYEQMVGGDWSLGVRGVARTFNEVIEDYTIDQGLWEVYGVECFNPDSPTFGRCAHEYRLANPGSDFEGFYDLDGDGEYDRISMSAEELGYPEAVRKYYAVELTFKRRFADNWMLQGSYTWSHLYGNYEGWTNSDIGSCDPGTNQIFDFPGLTDYAEGDLPQDRRHNLKLLGAYAFNSGFQFGGNLYLRSGRPINSLGVHPTDPGAALYGPMSFFTNGEPMPRGSQGTTDTIWGLDTMFKYGLVMGGFNIDLRLDVFNIFDGNDVTEVNEFGEMSLGVANPNYRRPKHHQSPRSVRLGVGLHF